MKLKLSLLGILFLASQAASAAGMYVLNRVNYANGFIPPVLLPNYYVGGSLPGVCTGCGVSMAAVDGSGNVALANVSWSVNAPANGVVYSIAFDATTAVGGGPGWTLNKLNGHTCVETLGVACSGNLSGYGGNTWYHGLAQDGTTPLAYSTLAVIENPGVSLTIRHQMALSEANTQYQYYELAYTAIPVPAAVWLMGSALGLLGWVRRKLIV